MTLAATWHVADTVRTAERAGFERLLQKTQDEIEERMATYIAFLRATRGLFGASGLVTREDFRVFVDQAELQGTYPGIQGVGVGRRILGKDKDALVAAMRKEIPDFRVWPEGQRDEYEPVVYLEPQDSRNRIAIGYDMFSEPVRRAAMERARDTGLPISTGRITLVYDPDRGTGGFHRLHGPLSPRDADRDGGRPPRRAGRIRVRLVPRRRSPARDPRA